MKRITLVFVMLVVQAMVFSQGGLIETKINTQSSIQLDTIKFKNGYGQYRQINSYDQNGYSASECFQVFEGEIWKDLNLYSYMYDENGNMLSKLAQRVEENMWTNDQLYTNIYNEDDQILSEQIQEWINDSWVNIQHNIYSYNLNGDLLTFQNQSWGPDGTLFHNHLSTYTYNEELLQFYIFQEWIDNSWQNSWKHLYSYDDNNYLGSETEQIWSETEWKNYYKISWTNDNEGKILNYITQHWIDESWINDSKRIHEYDNQGNMVVDIDQTWWGAEGWKNNYQYILSYDEEGNLLTYLSQGWLIDNWNNRFINTFTYDDQNHLLTNKRQEWEDDILINKHLFTDSYDEDGNRISQLHQNWHNETWYNHTKIEYEFLPNKIVATEYDWKTTHWEEHWLSTYIDIIMNGESIYSRTAIKVEISYSELTDIEENYSIPDNLNFQIKPNPTRDYITITKVTESVREVSFYNQSGQKFLTIKSPCNNIDISNLPPGLYFAQIKTSEGNMVRTVVVQ